MQDRSRRGFLGTAMAAAAASDVLGANDRVNVAANPRFRAPGAPTRSYGLFSTGSGLGGRETFPRMASSMEMLLRLKVWPVTWSSVTFARA